MKKALLAVFFAVLLLAYGAGDVMADQSKTPQRGGILRLQTPNVPRVIGYWPEMGQMDIGNVYAGIEFLMNTGLNRDLIPILAESVKVDEKKPSMTFKIRKGIKFHDGTDLNAEVAAWNFKMLLEGKKVRFGDNIKSIEVADPYTLVLNVGQYNNQLLFAYGYVPMFSQQAFETKGKEWCRLNPVGTGPFRFVDFKRDQYLKWERNPNYWQKGLPYLDGVEISYVTDPVTGSNLMQAKQVDMWNYAPVRDQADLVKKGFQRQSGWAGLPWLLYLNTARANAPTTNQKVREAIEYAIDKPAIAKALGFGFYTPLKMTAPETEWGYDPKYEGRTYNPAMAKKLLAEAGYPSGLKLKILAQSEAGGRNPAAEAIKTYMDQAGFNVDVDIADPGRFFSSLWVSGWDDMVLFFTGLDINYLATAETWFGHEPLTNLVSFKRPPEFIDLCKQASLYSKAADQKKATEKIVRMIADEALIIPLWVAPAASIHQPWVHTTYYTTGFNHWRAGEDWMEKH